MAITEEPEVDRQVEPRDPIVRSLAAGEPEATATRYSPGNALRFLILIAIIAFLGIYVGPTDIAATLLKVAVAVVGSGLLFVLANWLFDQTYPRWTFFNTVIGIAAGFALYILLECNGAFRSLFDQRVTFVGIGPFDVNPWLWGGIGAAAGGFVLFALSAPRHSVARFPLALIGAGGFGLLTALAFDESARPALDWAKLWICVAVGAAVLGLVALARGGTAAAPLGALTGAGLGWLIGAWGGGDIGRGNLTGVLLATVVPGVILGARFGLTGQPEPARRRVIERKARAWIFLTPALLAIGGGLVIPLIKTIYTSFRDRNGAENVGIENYRDIFGDRNAFNLDTWSEFVTSRLFWIGLAIGVLGIIVGIVSGRRTRQVYDKGEASSIPLFVGFFLIACAVLSTVRGTIFNNIWWVLVVTTVSTAVGLGVAVLADRAKGEQVAKSLIFLPMAISFVGAGIIWRFMYIARPPNGEQTGVLNSVWVALGQVSNSTTARTIAVAVLALAAVCLGLLALKLVQDDRSGTAGIAIGFVVLIAYFVYRLLGPGLGGFVTTEDGGTRADTIIFFEDLPFNNIWLMVILIWIQTGFAMVILSSAIKAVPQELTEAARIDGASQNQIFWRITVPQIAPTIGVVVTTLIVTVMKVFDIVKVSTNGNSGTQVIANQMFTSAFGNSDEGLGSALAVILFVSIIPVMYVNIRRMQSARA